MSVALEIEGAPSMCERIALRAGQVATVGRSPWADVSLPHARDLADEHFRIDCRLASCRVEPLGGTVLRNGVQTSAAALVDGDALTAGSLQFRVRIFGLTQNDGEPAPRGLSPAAGEGGAVEFAEIVQRAALSPLGFGCLVEGDRLATLDALLEAGLTKDACRFTIACLPRAQSVEWAIQVLEGAGLALEEQSQLLAVLKRQVGALSVGVVEDRIAAAPPNSPAAWLWKAARWSGGSLLGPELPPVPPPPHLFTVALSVALSLGAARRRPDSLAQWITSVRDQLVTSVDDAEK